MADMRAPFEEYIERAEPWLREHGVGKIVPPREWVPRRGGYEDLQVEIPTPIRQHATGGRGVFRSMLVECKPLPLRGEGGEGGKGFRELALEQDRLRPAGARPEDLERRFWKNVPFSPPMYGADVEGSASDADCQGWSVPRLDTLLTRTLREQGGARGAGVVSPYLYFGMWRSFFGWHTEDLDLYSMNLLHFGAPKTWYCVPPRHRRRFEEMAKGLAPDLFQACPEFLRHKELLIAPSVLRKHGIEFSTFQQGPREWVINYPGAYHAGFNHGYNCAESTNFATREWIPIGAKAKHCFCRPDTVRIDMGLFSEGGAGKESSSDSGEGAREAKTERVPRKKALSPTGGRRRLGGPVQRLKRDAVAKVPRGKRSLRRSRARKHA
jgi:jumonji domain-containing protein 2